MTTPSSANFLRLSMVDDRRRDPRVALGEMNERNIVLHMEAMPGKRIVADIAVHRCSDLRILSARFSGVTQTAPPESRARDATDELFLGIATSGTIGATQRGREVALEAGDAVLLSRGEAGFVVAHGEGVGFLGLRIPRGPLLPLAPKMDDAVIRRIPRASAGLELLGDYARSVMQHRALAGPEARLIATHVHDLAALVIGAANDAWQFANGRGGRAALLWALKTDIAAHASDPALSVGAVAARHGISARYVHKLFEPTGVTFSEFVLARRLANAHAALVDRRFDDRSITSIALRVGFGDLSYFNRTFRRRFGKTPSDVRKNREGSE